MGAGSSASAGPGQYSLDDLLTHLSAEGVLTAAKVIATGEDMRLPLPLDYLQDKGAFEGAETPDAIIALDLDKFRDAVQSKLVERAAEQAEAMEEKPADIYRYLTPLEARRGFPQALAALKANPKLARQPMPGSGRGSKWLPLHCVLLLGPKYPGWWWPLAEPLVKALCKAFPGACEQRVLEGSPHPCGQLPLELAVTKGWDARVVDVVQKTYPKAAETLDPVKVPGGILKKAFPPPGKGLPDQEFLNELGGPEVLSNDIKGATVAVLALSGWNKDKQPTTPKGMRWVRKAAEECRPLPKLEVVMLLPKPDPKNLENGWSDGREVQRLLEEKLHKKACKDAKNASKRAKKAEGFAKKALPFKPGKPVPVDALKAKHAIRESFEAAQIYDQLLADFHAAHTGFVVFEGWEEASKDFVEKRAAVLEKADLIAAAQELFEAVPEGADVGSAARKWVDAQEIRDEQEREKKTLDDIGTGGAPIIRSAPHEGSKL